MRPAQFVIAIAFLAAAELIWRGSRIGYIVAIVMSLLFIGASGSMAAASLSAFADLPSFLEVIVILPALILVFIYSILGARTVWRKGSTPSCRRMIPTSSVLVLLTIGFVAGGSLIGVLANGAIQGIAQNPHANVNIVVGAANTGISQPFSPSNFTVKVGGTVTWFNNDTS